MDINRNISMTFRTLMILFVNGLSLFSCTDEVLERGGTNNGKEPFPEGTDTYYNFVLHLGTAGETKSGPSGDTEGTAEENAVKNVAVIFFDKDGLFETVGYFNAATLTTEDGSGNLGGSATEGVTLKKAMPITSGKKKVAVIVNYDQYYGAFAAKLSSLLVKGSTTWDDFNRYKLDFLWGYASYPTRWDLPKYNDYKAPAPAASINLELAGVDPWVKVNLDYVGMQPASDGMMMTGFGAILLDAGVTETEATSGNRNLVTLYADRVMAKASLMFDKAMVYRTFDSPHHSVAQFDGYEVGTDNITPVEYATWWLANVPAEMYLMEHETGSSHPYYDQSTDFDMWQNKMQSNWNRPYITKDTSSVYTVENLVKNPVRGNVTYAVVKAKFTLYNLDEEPNEPGPDIISNRAWNGVSWATVNVTHLPFGGSTNNNLWRLTNSNDGKTKWIVCNKTMDMLAQNFKWMLYYPDAPGEVFAKQMTTYQRTKAEQDNAALDLSGGSTITPGWYIFYYDAKVCHTGKWYDEFDIYYYNGLSDASGWQRGDHKIYTAAFYANSYCYYRVNLEDVDQKTESARFAVHRNDWFQINIKKINELGYPDEEDLASDPDGKLTDSWLEVDIKVQDWREGGKNVIEIEQ